jgi:flagellar assembly protein FliH
MTMSKLQPSPLDSDANSKAASVHTRFIPREEMGSFSSWMPKNLEGGSAFALSASSADLRAAAAPPAASPYVAGVDRRRPTQSTAAQAASQAAATAAPPAITAADLAAASKTARQSGYQDGYRDGLAAMESFKQSFAMQVTAQVGSLVQAMGHQFDDLQQDMARAIAVSATHLAKHVVRCELQSQPELISAVAEEALDALLQGARHTTLRIHPDDHALVAAGAAEALRSTGARLLSDAAVSRGGCVVESDIGKVDASIEARWQRAAAALGSEEKWQSRAPSTAKKLPSENAEPDTLTAEPDAPDAVKP